jgi:hypothetical protein
MKEINQNVLVSLGTQHRGPPEDLAQGTSSLPSGKVPGWKEKCDVFQSFPTLLFKAVFNVIEKKKKEMVK